MKIETQTNGAELSERMQPLLERAKSIYASIEQSEGKLRQTRDELLMHAYCLGDVLTQLKATIGHGRWLFWLGGNWPDLGERNARRCMALFRENPESVDSTDLSPDSIRQFLWGYIPAKERPELPGDKPLTPHPHPLTFVNNFAKWDRQAELGLITRPPVETLRVDLAPVVRRIAELGGREWIESLLE